MNYGPRFRNYGTAGNRMGYSPRIHKITRAPISKSEHPLPGKINAALAISKTLAIQAEARRRKKVELAPALEAELNADRLVIERIHSTIALIDMCLDELRLIKRVSRLEDRRINAKALVDAKIMLARAVRDE